MSEIAIPALRNDEALGFLAALGLLSVIEFGFGLTPRLGWSGVGGEATVQVVEEDWDSERLVDALSQYVRALSKEAPAHPSLIGFPIPKAGTRGADPMRMSFREARGWYTVARDAERDGNQVPARWLVGTVNCCARRPDKPDQALSPLYAPTGQQTLWGSLDDVRRRLTEDPGLLRESLFGWRRVIGFSGANLDFRGERDASTIQDPEVKNAGVPGATWLAYLALPQLRLVGDGQIGGCTLFQRLRGRQTMVWPLWSRPLPPQAVRALIEHPVLKLTSDSDRIRLPNGPAHRGIDPRRQLRALGVNAVAWSQRRSLSKSEGPFGPATLLPVG